uniref:RNase H family protein n=1 Tax=Solanum tuberosum TaxID=4113 RepID=M1BRC9_SOLTU
MVNNKSNNNLKLRQIIDNIVEIVDQSNAQVTHCFRESNQVADFLAKRAARLNQMMILTSFRPLPEMAKGAYFLDKCQLPCIRTKFDKANFFVS